MISIITPHYNGAVFHERFFKGLLEQTFIDWELIVIDDCSEKYQYVSVKRHISKDSRCILLRNDINRGVSFSRNRGLLNAKGSYIAFLDIDDIWHCNKLKFQYNTMIASSIDFCCTAFTIVDEKLNIIGFSSSAKELSYDNLLKFNINIACSSVMLRRESVGNFFNESMSHAEDYLLWGQILSEKRFNSMLINDPKYLVYLKSRNSLSSSKFKQLLGVFEANTELVGSLRAVYFTTCYVLNSLRRLVNFKMN